MRLLLSATLRRLNGRHYSRARGRPPPPPPPPAEPPKPPKPPKKPQTFTLHNATWQDEYSWMSKLHDKVAMTHMDVHVEAEDKYAEAVMSAATTDKLQAKLLSEMASRFNFDLSTPPLRWGPWLYYRRVEEGKQYHVLCRRLVKLHEQLISNRSPSAGFDFVSGKKIEQKLIDYNQEAQRFGGYAFEELSEISPDHKFIAYTMYDKDNDYFRLSVRNLNSGALCSKPQVDRVSGLAWAKDGQALIYAVTDQYKRPCRVYCSMIGSVDEDVLLLDEPDDKVYVNIRHTKDFRYVTVYASSPVSSKVFLINAANPLSGMTFLWESEAQSHCIVEHHQGFLYMFTDAARNGQMMDHHYLLRSPVNALHPRVWESVFSDSQDFIIEDVDFCDKHMVLSLRQGRSLKLCAVPLPLPAGKKALCLEELNPKFLPLPNHVCKITPGPNYDYYSSFMRFTISSPVMPDAVVDFDLSTGKWSIIQQHNVLHERTKTLYGTVPSGGAKAKQWTYLDLDSSNEVKSVNDNLWNELSEFYACEQYDVPSYDGVLVPLTIVYSRKMRNGNESPGLLHGYGAYGEVLDKRWRSELKSLLDRGWVIAFADVRGGGGQGKRWHHDGRRAKKLNSIRDYISCAKYLTDNGLVHQNKLCGWGYSAGGLLVASAINFCPDLFRAVVLKVPFLDATNTLLHPILPLTPADYEEFGYPGDIDEFCAIQQYSPYDNIQNDVSYPGVLITSSFNTNFGVWEAAKWAARVRDRTIYDPNRPVLLNLILDLVEENRYMQCKESATEAAFLIDMVES